MHSLETTVNTESKVTTTKLVGGARAIIDQYLALPIGPKPSCPYYNNKRKQARSALRVLKGKGSPKEIAEEAEIDALHCRLDMKTVSTDKLKEFLVAQNLGVDCSGFAYHVLNAIAQEKKGRSLRAFVTPNRGGFVGSIIARLRPAENMGVATFANDRNSTVIAISDARPGDIITFIGTGKDGLYNHILVITGVEHATDNPANDRRISYAHSYAWPSDGASGHGVREGDILVHDNDLMGATWKEKSEVGSANYTFESARTAKVVSVRRLKFLA